MQPARNNARKKSNRVKEPIESVAGAHGTFLLLHFVDHYEELVDQEDFISSINPTMTFSGNDVIIDYGLAYTKSEDAKNKLLSFFDSKNLIGKSITLTSAEYTDPIKQGNGDVFDVAGTYTFNSFDKESGIISATKVSANNLSDTMSQYKSDYWINYLTWTENTITPTKTIEENAIVNKAGFNSINSFMNELGQVFNDDILTVQFPNKKTTSIFTVTGTRTDEDGHEWIHVEESVPDDSDGTTYFGEKVYISVSRRKGSQGSQRSLDPIGDVSQERDTGACCVENNIAHYCRVITPTDCDERGGVFKGLGTDCTWCRPENSTPGACCKQRIQYPWETCTEVHIDQCHCHPLDWECTGTEYHGDGTACHEPGEIHGRCNKCLNGPAPDQPTKCTCVWKDSRFNDPNKPMGPLVWDQRECESRGGVGSVEEIDRCNWSESNDGGCYCSDGPDCFQSTAETSCCCGWIFHCTETEPHGTLPDQDFTHQYGCGKNGIQVIHGYEHEVTSCAMQRKDQVQNFVPPHQE